MEYEISAPRGKSIGDRVHKITLKAGSEFDQVRLMLLANALVPVSEDDRDKEFDDWFAGRIAAYCKANKVTIVHTPKPATK